MVQQYLNRMIMWSVQVIGLVDTGSKFLKDPPQK